VNSLPLIQPELLLRKPQLHVMRTQVTSPKPNSRRRLSGCHELQPRVNECAFQTRQKSERALVDESEVDSTFLSYEAD
jgi:hypothetical protein